MKITNEQEYEAALEELERLYTQGAMAHDAERWITLNEAVDEYERLVNGEPDCIECLMRWDPSVVN